MGLLAGGTLTTLVMTFRWLQEQGVNSQGAGLAAIIPLLFNNLFLLILSFFGLLYLLLAHELPTMQLVAFAAADYLLGLGLLVVGYGLPLLLGKIGLLPGGVGVIEGAMATLYSGFGVPKAIVVVVILAYRFLSFWLPILVGFYSFPISKIGSQLAIMSNDKTPEFINSC